MSGETIDIYIPQLGAVRYNEPSKDIEVGIDRTWVPIWRIGNIQQLPTSVVLNISELAAQYSPETLSYRSAMALATLAGPLAEQEDLIHFPEEGTSYSSEASDYSNSASSTESSEASRYTSSDRAPNRHPIRCTCNVCTAIRDLSRLELERMRREQRYKQAKIENPYTKKEDGKYDRTVSYSKSRKLMLP